MYQKEPRSTKVPKRTKSPKIYQKVQKGTKKDQTLPEAQRTQGIDSVPQKISTACYHLNFRDNSRYGVNTLGPLCLWQCFCFNFILINVFCFNFIQLSVFCLFLILFHQCVWLNSIFLKMIFSSKACLYNSSQSNKFTEEDIKILVKQFKMDFPTGKVTQEKSLAIVRKVFPR